MARVLHGIPIGTLPEPGDVNPDDQIVAYRQSDGQAYRTNVDSLSTEGLNILDHVYPVGSIYMSMVDNNPENFIGGQWEELEDTFLYSAGHQQAGETGGSETVALSVNNLPAHSHELPAHTHSLPSHTHSLPSHTHSIPSHTHSIPSHTHSFSATTSSSGSHTHTLNVVATAAGGGTLNRPSTSDAATGTYASAINSAGAHTHTISGTTGSYSGTTGSYSGTTGSASGTSGSTSGTSGSTSGTSGETGNGEGFSVMPPYTVVHMWQRTA